MRRCFCCWRLVRPPGDPAAEEEALLVRGKSQLILHGSPGPRPWKALACFSQLLNPAVPQRQEEQSETPGSQVLGDRVFSKQARLRGPWVLGETL